ncbi:MAG: DUF4003 domain-containing protein [Bifidobacteriaceae bacterium]|jgi:hypothetical protein|nr:DUF4003 domain-containing protein [Bifidobacteriaceae bacterium]
MKPDIERTLALLKQNIGAAKGASGLRWQGGLSLAAFLYAQAGRQLDADAIRGCLDLIKRSTGLLSAPRGDMSLSLATLLSLSANPQQLLTDTLEVYGLLKAAKLGGSPHLLMAAHQIASRARPTDFGVMVERTRALYDGMKADHRFLTGRDDYTLAAMLALSNLDVDSAVSRIAQVYQNLDPGLGDKNGAQELAQVLTLGGGGTDAEERAVSLRAALKARKARLYRAHGMGIIGLIALLGVDVETAADQIDQIRVALKGMSLSQSERLVLAGGIVANQYATEGTDPTPAEAVRNSITGVVSLSAMAIILEAASAVVAAAT